MAQTNGCLLLVIPHDVDRSRLSENFERPPALMWMIEPTEQIDYTAAIASTDDTRHPFAVIVTARGDEVARKRVRTVEEAELFVQLLFAALELNVLHNQGKKPH